VTLTGIARWASERADAEDVVRHVRGVRRIVNEITVSQVPNARGFEPPDDDTR
jgi:osmotically-inducible protein OsmY